MKLKYCPNCGAHKTITRDNPSNPTCQKCGTIFWNNPSATVAVIFRKGDQLLFAKRGIDPNKGKYDFPGGFVNYNEDIYEACVREIQEETTVKIKPDDLSLVTGYTSEYIEYVSVVDLVFIVKAWQGSFSPHDDVAALEWKPIDFINSDMFAVDYKGLSEKIVAIE